MMDTTCTTLVLSVVWTGYGKSFDHVIWGGDEGFAPGFQSSEHRQWTANKRRQPLKSGTNTMNDGARHVEVLWVFQPLEGAGQFVVD